jgi:hypothetical protein
MNMYKLTGIDGNAYSIMGYVSEAMKEQKFAKEDINEYIKKATSSDYYHLLRVSLAYIGLCNDRAGEPTKETEVYEDKRPMVFSVDD